MIAIRGATTIENDNVSEINDASVQLIDEIILKNSISKKDIVCIMISTTSDIKSSYPAKAIREAGFSCALYSSLEPEIKNSLKKCIRFMLLIEKDIKIEDIKHIYLKKAKILRKDLSIINIAIDGPAGSGKSTIAKFLSKKLDILYLDTGAMYRACALKSIKENVDLFDESKLKNIINTIKLKINYENFTQHTYLDEEDVSEKIRAPEVSMAASNISSLKCVREKMIEMQREIAKNISCVLDGRDIGSFVLPNADFKFFVTANSEIRAKRRYDELIEKGFKVDFNELHQEIKTRDYNDSHREFSPLIKADDAILIDTSYLTIEEVIQKIESYLI